MNNIVICIPTYKRPVMLKKLVASISECNFSPELIKNVSINVMDNDGDRSAEKLVQEMSVEFRNRFSIRYHNHSAKGISNVRNKLIEEAFLLNPDFIVFIDDDEYVTPEWLNELIKTINTHNSEAARGPVLAMIEGEVSPYVAYWFKREQHADGARLDSLKTGNLVLRCSSLQKLDLWFDPRFNIIGSGDNYFGVQFLKKGASIYWAAKAVAYENIPAKRASLNWLVKRVYRYASTYMYVLKLEKQYFAVLKKILVSCVYVISGILGLVLLLLPVKMKYWGVLKLTEGVGGFSGIFNMMYKEYK